MLEEFKKFILKGNVVDLATGVIIGAAFGGIVKSFTDGVVTPLLNLMGGGTNVGLKVWIFDLGIIISAVINFLITATVIFFVIVKPTNTLLARMKRGETAPPPASPSEEVKLLTEIRDALKKQ
jgi:large conductance mechanosensitive channel